MDNIDYVYVVYIIHDCILQLPDLLSTTCAARYALQEDARTRVRSPHSSHQAAGEKEGNGRGGTGSVNTEGGEERLVPC